MKSIEYETKAGRKIKLITRDEVLKAMVEAKTYITKRFKETLIVKKALEEIKRIEEEIPLVMESKTEDADILLNDFFNYISLKRLEKRKRVLETAVDIYSYIYDNEVQYINLDGKRTPVNEKEFENADILPENWKINDAFATKLGTYLYNKANATDDYINEEEYLKIEEEYLSNKKNRKRNTKKTR